MLDDQRIKDLRTNVQTGGCDKVLDGDLDQFIVASLKAGLWIQSSKQPHKRPWPKNRT